MDNNTLQRFKTIRDNVNQIKNISNSELSQKDIQKYQKELQNHLSELKKLTETEIILPEIEELKKTINMTKNEIAIDPDEGCSKGFRLRAPSTFSRQNKENSRLKQIRNQVEKLTKSIHRGNNPNQENLDEILMNYSKQLTKFKNKSNREEIDKIQELISSTISCWLLKGRTNAMMINNKWYPPLRETQNDRRKQPQRKSNVTALVNDIEYKMQILNNEIEESESNKDGKSLNYLTKSIEMLITELELIEAPNEAITTEEKNVLEEELMGLYDKVEKIRSQMGAEDDLRYLLEIQQREKQENLQELENISIVVDNIHTEINRQNYKDNVKSNEEISWEYSPISAYVSVIDNISINLKRKKEEQVRKYRRCVDSVLQVHQKIEEMKKNLDNFPIFVSSGIEDKLKEANRKYYNYQMTYASELIQLLKLVPKIIESNSKIGEMKNDLVYKIGDDLRLLTEDITNLELKQNNPSAIYANGMLNQCMIQSMKSEENYVFPNNVRTILEEGEFKMSSIKILERDIQSLEEQFETKSPREKLEKSHNQNDQFFFTSNLMSENEKDFNQKFKNLKELVSNFNGSYKGNLYQNIENALEKYSKKADEVFVNKNKAAEIKEEISNQKLLLVQKASNLKNSNDLLNDDLDNCLKAITLRKLEQNFEGIQAEILRFVGLETSQKYIELDETMMQITLALNDLKLDRNSYLYERKSNLLRKMERYSEILEERASQTEEIENWEKEMQEILMKINSHNVLVREKFCVN